MPIAAGLLAAQALSAGAGAAQAIAGSRKSKFDKRNDQELNRLLGLKERDQLGLSGAERSIAERGLLDPVRSASAATRRQSEAALSGSGASGAELSRLRQEQTGAIAQAGERAALALDQADQRKEAAQRQELAQREQIAESRRQERQASLFAGLGQAAGAAGQLAGGVPEVLRAAGLAGAPISDTSGLQDALASAGVTGESAQLIMRMNPRQLTRAMSDAEKFLETGDAQYVTQDSVDIIRAVQNQRADDDLAQSITFQGA